MENNHQLIKKYVNSLNPNIFGVSKLENIEVETLPQGNWNFNYAVSISGKKFVFKLYSPNGTGFFFGNSGKNEFLILNAIKDLRISPKPVHFDESSTFFNHSVLIYEYAEGQRLKFSDQAIQEIAQIFAKIHSLEISKVDFIEKKDHSVKCLMQEIIKSFDNYEQRDDAKEEEIRLFWGIIEKVNEHISEESIAYPATLVHTDPVPSNFIVGDKLSLIDWQRPVIADPAFDIWAFLSEPFNLRDLPDVITEEQKELFLKTYLGLREDRSLIERIKSKEPLYLLQLGLFCLVRYSDYKSGKISADVLNGREANFERYGKTKEVIIRKLKEILKLSSV